MSVMRPELIMKSIIPVIMAGIIAIYGLVVAILVSGSLKEAPAYSLYKYVDNLLSTIAAKVQPRVDLVLQWVYTCLLFFIVRLFNLLQRILTSGCRISSRFQRVSSWFCYWYRRRCWCSRYCPTTTSIRWYDSDSYFR